MLGGGTPNTARSEFWEGNIPWVSPKDMKRDHIFNTMDHISDEAIKGSTAKLLPVGSILFVVRGMILNHTLPVAKTEVPVAINQDMKALIPEMPEIAPYLLIAGNMYHHICYFQ